MTSNDAWKPPTGPRFQPPAEVERNWLTGEPVEPEPDQVLRCTLLFDEQHRIIPVCNRETTTPTMLITRSPPADNAGSGEGRTREAPPTAAMLRPSEGSPAP